MAQIIVRNLDASVKNALRSLASLHGHSMEEEAREILRKALLNNIQPQKGLGTLLVEHFEASPYSFTIKKMTGSFSEQPEFEE